jgi:hypothetical protein
MSAATRNQVIAFIITVVICFVFLLAGFPLVLRAGGALQRAAARRASGSDQNGLYTLSDGTLQASLEELEEPVNLYFFCPTDAAHYPNAGRAPIRTRCASSCRRSPRRLGGKIRLTVIDPLPFSEEEDKARALACRPFRSDLPARMCSSAWPEPTPPMAAP